MSEQEQCYASRIRGTIIDTIRSDGLTTCYGKTYTQVLKEYPDAYRTSVIDFCAWKGQQQRSPITWSETTEEIFMDMLNVLPPAIMLTNGFLVGEAADHEADTGKPRYDGFKQIGDKFYASSRPMTRAEFKKEVGI
jgi:hypothetical protein